MVTRLALVAPLLLLAAACGGEAPTTVFVAVPGMPWAKVTQQQVDAARAMGVPVAREHAEQRFVYIPAGTFLRRVGDADYEVNIGVGFYISIAASAAGASRDAAAAAASAFGTMDPGFDCRLPTEAEWAYAQRFLPPQPTQREWMLDRFGPLPTWTVSDPHGPREGEANVVRAGGERMGLPGPTSDVVYRFVRPLGYGLGAYGATAVTFRLVDEFATADAAPIPGGYDLRVISMNDRLQARTLGEEAHWQLVREPGSPVTLTMVPGAYYVYAERTRDGQLLRGKEMKFYVADQPVERTVPIPEKDQRRYGSGGREKPQ